MWAMGKIFPHLLAWFVRRRMKKGGMDGFAGFGGPGGFAGFWSNMGPQGGPVTVMLRKRRSRKEK